jgi:hypothetical protein
VTILFLLIIGVGVMMLLSTLAVSRVFADRDDGDGPPIRLLAQTTGIMGVGVGGLIATSLGLDDFGLAMTTLVVVVVVLGVLYGLVLPYLRKRRSESPPGDPARSSGGFTA